MPKILKRIPKKMTTRAGDWLYNEEFYLDHLRYNPETSCTEWIGVTNNIGYGFIGVADTRQPPVGEYKMVTTHRLALTRKLGRPIQAGMNANHSCHNRRCCTEEHLFEGTQKQKIHAMRNDNRQFGVPKGTKRGSYSHSQENRQYRYTEEEIQWVRQASVEEIMQRFSCIRRRAHAMRHQFRRGYRWLPQ